MLMPAAKFVTSDYNTLLCNALNTDTGGEDNTTNKPEFKGRFITIVENCFEDDSMRRTYQDSVNTKSSADQNYNFLEDLAFEPFKYNRVPLKGCEYVDLLGGRRTTDLGVDLIAPYVKFDRSCKLANEDDVRTWLTDGKATESMAKFICTNLEKMATLGDWSNQEVPMFVNITRYTLNSDNPEIVNLPWSPDWAPLSMTAVISPCKQEGGKYSGGDLLFAEKAQETYLSNLFPQVSSMLFSTFSNFFPQLSSMLFSTEKHIAETVKQYSYPENGCFITENVFSIGTASGINLDSGEACQRVVITFSAYPDKQQFLSFMEKNSGQNLLLKDSPDIS
ncbi:hypothetical protein [Endozoicomonas sp. ALC013]|uniref:hypothetical protein n=1 Tax=Endozoicomonas sp. ALC013 TaxID=3403076 RepID=UPI003BB6C624